MMLRIHSPLKFYFWWYQRYLIYFGHINFIIFVNLFTLYTITIYKISKINIKTKNTSKMSVVARSKGRLGQPFGLVASPRDGEGNCPRKVS